MTHRIVVCDDEPHITRALSMKLTRAGFEVEMVSDGEAAWEAIQREAPDLLITDFQMPRLDGMALCRRLRDDIRNHDLPIIMLTAKGFELDENQLKSELGIVHVAMKPFSPREILMTVQEILGLVETET